MPAAGILPGSLAILRPSNHSLSSCRAITGPDLFCPFTISSFSLVSTGYLASPAIIRMGGGPRTFPGGVSKWQWKRMQAKKAQQLLKARLCRERQLYEMRKRAELKAAISELERPWEVVERAPVLFAASADEQVKVLADRFQRPSGFDMWSERDGPQLFLSPDDLPSARFFPKGAVHSLKPYSVASGELPNSGVSSDKGDGEMMYDDWIARGAGGIGRGRRSRRVSSDSSSSETIRLDPRKSGDADTGVHQISYRSDLEHLVAESREEEKKEVAGLLNRHDRNHGRQESDVAGLTTEGDEMAVELGSDNDRTSASNLSESELALPNLSLEVREMAGSFGRRGGRVSRGRNRVSYGSHSALPVTNSMVKEGEKFCGFNRRRRDSKMDGQKMPNDIDQLAVRGNRSGRNRNHGSFRSYSTLSVAGSRREGGNFCRHGGHGQNGDSQFSTAKFGVTGSRMDDRGMDESFSRRGGHGGRRGRGGFQGSYRPHAELVVDDDSRTYRRMARDFGDRDGNYRWSRDPSSSNWDHSVARRTDGDYIAGGFVTHHGPGSRIGNRGVAISNGVGRSSTRGSHGCGSCIGNRRVAMPGSVGRGGGRGGYRVSYRALSNLVIAGSQKAREMGMDSRFGGSDQDYKGATRVSLRPTTDLR